jgi:phosphocarrier protein HPr
MSSQRGSGPTGVGSQLEIKNRLGLHARAAALIVQAVAKFDAEITVTKDDQSVNGKSILGLMMLAAGPGSFIDVSAQGPDAQAALDAITALVDARFNEDG